MSTVYNFSAGPAILPRPVLEQVQRELLDYQGRGMSIMEMSHRSKEYEAINSQAETTFKRLLGVGDGYRTIFVQGGVGGYTPTRPDEMVESAPGSEGFKQDFSKWDSLRKDINLALEQVESALSSQLKDRETKDRLNAGADSSAPASASASICSICEAMRSKVSNAL